MRVSQLFNTLLFTQQQQEEEEQEVMNTKVLQLEDSSGGVADLIVLESLVDEDSLVFTWESSLMMSAFIFSNRDMFHDKRVLEIGAGNVDYRVSKNSLTLTCC